jgi:hypothetical protein
LVPLLEINLLSGGWYPETFHYHELRAMLSEADHQGIVLLFLA